MSLGTAFSRLAALVPEPCAPIDWEGLAAVGLAGLFTDLERTMQNPVYHGEGDVLTHTKMVCEALVREAGYAALDGFGRTAVFLASLLHDIGKIKCTRPDENGVLRSPYHASKGAVAARRLLWQDFDLAGEPERRQMREVIAALIRYHSFPPFAAYKEDAELRTHRIASCGELAPGFTIDRLCLLERADILGRIGHDTEGSLEKVELCRMIAEEAGCLLGPYSFPNPYSQHAYFTGKTGWRDQDLFCDTWGEVILLSGLPGTGKDTWLSRNLPDLPMVSLDNIRERLHISPNDKQAPVVAAAQEEAREYLRKRQPFVWNATSLTVELRANQISLFEQYGASVKIVFLETGWEEQLRRNASRTAVVPQPVIEKMLRRLEIPERHECERVVWETV